MYFVPLLVHVFSAAGCGIVL